MANPGGGVGAKFVSVNLNKSYGQSSHHSHQPYGGSYGHAAAAGRGRPSSGGGGSGGMVVLSRGRIPQKAAAPKLSVPPPLNLPSLRKEHEKNDSLGSGGGAAAGAGAGTGPRPSSSGMGWTKPVAISLQEKDAGDGDARVGLNARGVDGDGRLSSAYMPPSARPAAAGIPTSATRSLPKPVERAVVLKGEDFPSLQAALPVLSGPGQKPKDNVNHKQKPAISEESVDQQQGGFQSNSRLDARSHVQDSRNTSVNGSMDNTGDNKELGSYHMASQIRKEDFFSSPLPLVRLNPRSDWADDERDTGYGIVERSRDTGFSKTENYWERDFDMPRTSVLPHRSRYERRGLKDDDTGRNFSSDVSKVDPYRREVRMPSREGKEGNMWCSSPPFKDVQNAQEVSHDKAGIGARSFNKVLGNENRFVRTHIEEPAQDSVFLASQESAYGRRNTGKFSEARPQRNSLKDSYYTSRGAERISQDHYGPEQSSRYRADGLLNSTFTKPSFASGGKLPSASDSFLASGRDNRGAVKTERQYFEDPFLGSSGFDDKDPFSGGLVGVIKRRKDVVKQSELHDPVRESFEAELERVQKMQELERRRAVEEQERALEQARREEEERQRLIREEEERLQRLEDETREASWRAEQERLESLRKAEELKVAREEEKRRIQLEEERRKQAAKQKLIELEQKMAKREAESMKSDSFVATLNPDEKLPSMLKDKDVSTTSTDLETWEDSERMVERLTTSSSVDSSGLSRPFEINSRSFSTRESSAALLDRGKPFNSWRRDVFENGSNASSQMQEHEINHFSPQRDSFAGVRAVGRKEFNGGAGYASRVNMRGMPDPYLDEFGHQREQRWNFSGDVDAFSGGRDIDTEFRDNFSERYTDVGWAQNHFRGSTHSPYPERPFMNSEADDLYPYGRPRYSMRQPRVLPPPIASTQRTSFRIANERPGPSGLLVDNEHGSRVERSESTRPTGYYSGLQNGVEHSELVDRPGESATVEDQRLNKDLAPRCDSQSSVSVSSPPSSPPHLSHDELDDSGDSPILSSTGVGKHILQTGNEAAISNDISGHHKVVTASDSISASEDEEWAIENNAEQEEYDEEEVAYQEEDEVREGDDENLDLKQDFGDVHLEDNGSSHMMDNLVLGFDEGIEVELPNDDVGVSESSIQNLREQGLGDDVQGDEQHNELSGGFPSGTTVAQETVKAMQDFVVKPCGDPYSSISDGPSLSFQPISLSPAADVQSSTGLTTASTPSSTLNQVDTPIKLQFGLFSGPSLIPSPVTAIQIGSIQMPLHLHPPIGPSITHVHPSQPPLFQFGQVRYTSPISRGILPIAPPSISFSQPSVPVSYSFNQNAGGSLPNQPPESTSSQKVVKGNSSALALNNKPGCALGGPSDTPGNSSVPGSSGLVRQSADSTSQTQTTAVNVSNGSDDRTKPEVVGQAENRWHNSSLSRNRVSGKGRTSGNLSQHMLVSSECTSSERIHGGMRAHGTAVKGKRLTYAVKNSSTRPALPVVNESSHETIGFQRRSRRTVHRAEFRVRENVERRPQSGSFSNSSLNVDDKPNNNGRYSTQFARSGSKRRGILSSKTVKQIDDPEGSVSGSIVSQDGKSDSLIRKEMDNDISFRDQSLSQSGEGNVIKNIPEEDFDATLQSGVVRVFKQSGIEAPSDEDDFIKVRSKRQMLNDRREQKEKEIKANSRAPRKLRPARQVMGAQTNSRKDTASLNRESSPIVNSNFSSSDGRVYKEASPAPVSQPLGPIGTPAVKLEPQTDKRSQSVKPVPTCSGVGLTGGGKENGPAIVFESKNKAMDNVQSSLSSWDNAQLNQQVMSLTQTQLEEAMKAPRFDSSIASVGGHSSSVTEPLLPSSSLLGKDRPFSTSSSPINSLLAGEKIQFGAVTSPPILPHSSRAPGSNRPDVQIPSNLSVAEDDCTLFFKKDKQTDEPCTHVQDSEAEAEAEAAASAVAVAAIGSDEVVGNGLGSAAIPESKSLISGHIDGISTGMACDQQFVSQSRAEESLSVSLPADLSVETPSISLWPPLPSPQGSSNQMVSHFPGGHPPSHLPFYEMNPMLGGPVFAYGPSEVSVGSQSQTPKSGTASSSPLGTWPQCHSTMDSFYGHPAAGYTGSFISPPGVQGPPHMVVYNHFAPVGQYGQVGLSFMGSTYIPSGKHSDWKHNSPSSTAGITDGHMNSSSIAAGQRNHPNMAAPVQHLASGSPVMPIASPLAMFDVSPFQPAPDMSVQAHWSHVAAQPLHSVPLSRPLQQGEGILPSQLGHAGPVDQSLNVNRFSESQNSTPSTSGPCFTVASEVKAAARFSDDLGLANTSRAITTSIPSNPSTVSHSSSVSSTADVSHTGNLCNNEGPGNHGGFRMRSSQQRNSTAHQLHSSNHNPNYHQRAGSGASQRNNAGNEWSHRRNNYHGRNQSFGSEKGMPAAKVKQIYVAKQPSSSTPASG